ncbi:hypothetical protein WJX82_011004 [Trebouxia sp. C0006]
MHRLAQASVASSALVSDWVQPAGITSLLAWHRQSTTDHRKMFSSDDKQGRPHAATQDQAENSKQPSPDKPQQAGFEASAGTASAPEKTILQDPTDLLSFFSEPFRSLRGNLAVWAMQNRVETTFDEREFLEGAKDAWCAVNQCMNEKDYDKLAEMCTPTLMTMFREVLSQQSSQGRFFEVTDVEVQHAQVLGASFLLPDAPAVAAESKGSAAVAAPQAGNAGPREAHWSQWALKAAKDALGGSSVAMWVRFTGCLNKQLVKDKEGKVLSELEDRRSQSWLFVRGPLPDKLPVRELDMPWQLMGFQ